MRDFSDYRNPPSDTLVWSGKKLFRRKLEDFGEDVKVDGFDTKAIIKTHSNPYNEQKEDRKFLCDDSVEINRGSIVDYDGKKWLVVSEIKSNKVNKYTKIFQCNNAIKFYDKNHISYQIPCVVGNNINLGEEENKYFSEPSTNIIVRLPNNEITSQIKRDQIYKLGMQNYKVVDILDIIEPGLLILRMEYSQESQKEYNYILEILNGDSVDIQEGDTLQLNVNVLANNIPLSPTPPLIFTSSDELICSVDENGLVTANDIGGCEIAISLASDASVHKNININVIESAQMNYDYEMQGESEIVKGQSQVYTVNRYLNGVLVPDSEFSFSVVAGSTPVSAYELSVVDKNTCKITAKSSVYNIVLKAEDVSNGEFVEKNIRLKNLF